ncbi:MAG: CDP-diacylglycerol--serine O-phosphatidyltransferase [Alphaproteobacteria bacterium]|nr:CDP-diacylglycerol--serine O-phosphatidyltransferase [Alphaproteobacteria bacterium]
MDPVIPELEKDIRRRRRRRLFAHSRIPVRVLFPNFVTLFGLCAGLTSIRMSIEGRWDLALAAIVLAAMLDGLDGRVARLLKASSRFGAELDSLADFVNFGVAPAILIFTWGLGDLKSFGWICVLVFALASALRLARFNVALDEERPKWQSNYFSGVPTPAAAIVVLLPFYLDQIGLDLKDNRWVTNGVLIYTVLIATMMVSAIPTYSGKLLGERIKSEWVLPIFVAAVGLVACLVTYPYGTLALASLIYLAMIPMSWLRFRRHESEGSIAGGSAALEVATDQTRNDDLAQDTRDNRVVDLRRDEP